MPQVLAEPPLRASPLPARLKSKFLANLALVATMALVVLVLWRSGQLQSFRVWDEGSRAHPA